MKISGWGKFPKIESNLIFFKDIEELKQKMEAIDHFVVRGSGLSYGDSALNKKSIATLEFNRILGFDEKKGIIRVEAGACLKDIIEAAIPKGWFLSVTPGTKFVTVGGAIASDVHGKNHHKMGTFSDHVRSMDVMLPDGRVLTCSRSENHDLFRATCGGMGLTGIILNATIELKKIETAYIKQGYKKANNLDELIDLFEQHKDVSYSIAWIDCLSPTSHMGRGVFIFGEHATKEGLGKFGGLRKPLFINTKPRISIPFDFPSCALNRFSGKIFNGIFFHTKSVLSKMHLVDYDSFFYPLDKIRNWNRIYGFSGSTEYQFVLPKDTSREGLKSVIARVNDSGFPVFLAGLKLLGKQNDNLLSFPMHGYTLALEFPIKKGLFQFLNDLDKLVLDFGGRLYLSKDVRMSDQMFRKTHVAADQFIDLKRSLDKHHKLQSLQSKRLKI
jgi:decaprenylphospho-beta-D-ribofuranose 2-oxidase